MSGTRFEDVWMDWDGMGLDGPRSTHRSCEGGLREGSAHGSLHICIVLSSLWWLPTASTAPSCFIVFHLLTLLPHHFHHPPFLPFSAPVRSASGALWMRADTTNHWELGILITTSRRNWSIPRLFCIPLVSAKPKGRSKSSLHNLDNCPKTIEKHNHTRTARNSFKPLTEIAAAHFELQSPEVLICLDESQELSIEKIWFENRRYDNLARSRLVGAISWWISCARWRRSEFPRPSL